MYVDNHAHIWVDLYGDDKIVFDKNNKKGSKGLPNSQDRLAVRSDS